MCLSRCVLKLANFQHTFVSVVDFGELFLHTLSLSAYVYACTESQWIFARAEGLAERTSQTSSLWLQSLGRDKDLLKLQTICTSLALLVTCYSE